MKRRQVLRLIGGAAAWPLVARAQQAAMPVIGFLHPTSPDAFPDRLRGFRQGLKETGYVEVNPANPSTTETTLRDVEAAARSMGLQTQALKASTGDEIDAVFATLGRDQSDILFVGGDPFFTSRRVQLAVLAAHYSIPLTSGTREIAAAGGLMSYGANIPEGWREAGAYVGRILKGAKPADLPVVQSTKFELVINAQIAGMLGLTVPPSLLATADEVIE
jgi:putative ABC transport system substrate-binding protein